jgi:tRNA(Ile)-lysidine synthase
VREPGLAAWTSKLVAVDDLDAGARVVVGCSGGADSLALLALACSAGFDVVAVHVDHGLRAGTEHDERVVVAAARRFGADSRTVRIVVDTGSNLEARARDARYAALETARDATGAVAIFVGHTRDDQAETVLLNLLRGSGVAGLAGAPPVRGAVRRPLLALRRRDTREICARLRLAPVADPMNDVMHFRRVWLRRSLIPHLERGATRDLVDVLARQADVMRDDNELLEALAADLDPTDAAALVAAPRALARRAVRHWLGMPPATIATIDRVLDVASGTRRAAELPGGVRVERVRGRLHMVTPAQPASPAEPGAVPLRFPGRAAFGDVEVTGWIEHAAPVAWPDGRMVAVCDADAVGADAGVVRRPEPGERFRPFGSGGTKLVYDALAEVGVPAAHRSRAAVVAAPDVFWVVGYRIDHRVRVSARTRRFLWLSAEPGRS